MNDKTNKPSVPPRSPVSSSGETGDVTVNIDLSSLEEKICAVLGEEAGPNAFTKLCEILNALNADGPIVSKLCEILDSNTAWCTADGIFQAALLACMEQVKANTSAITGIETSMGQVGCVKDADGEITGAVLVCKVSDTTTEPPTDTIKVWLFNTDGTVVENYDGPYEGCTSLSELSDLLNELCDKVESVICPEPECGGETTGGNGGTPVGEPFNYLTIDTDTDYTVIDGVFNFAGDTIDAGAQVFADQINACLQAGNNIMFTSMTDPDGNIATATVIAADQTLPFIIGGPGLSVSDLVGFDGPTKISGGTAQCVTADGEVEPSTGSVFKVFDKCAVFCLKQIKDVLVAAQNCTKPLAVKIADVTIDECCTGGATPTTAKCANIPVSITSGQLGNFDRCTASFGGFDLPDDNYEYDDFAAIITNAGGTIVPNPNNPDQYTICVPDGFSTCYQRACFTGNVGQISRICFVATPNTTVPECKDFIRTWGKYEEPIGNTLATSLEVQEESLGKLCDLVDKQCLLLDATTNPNACGSPVPESGLDKEAQTLTLEGDVGEQYTEGKTISLKNSGGDICGSATSTGQTSFDEETGLTTITIEECELQEGKEAAQITSAAPVLQIAETAVKNIVKIRRI